MLATTALWLARYLHGFVKMRTAIYDDAIALLERAQVDSELINLYILEHFDIP